MKFTAADLAATLAVSPEESYVRVVAVAARHGQLPEDWLNDSVKGLLPAGADQHAKVILDLPGITVTVPSPHYLLPKAQFIVQEMFPADPAESSPP